jgi:hypothetical protein
MQERKRKRKAIIWSQQCISLIILDTGDLCDSTFDPFLREVHYYLFLIIAHFKSRTMEIQEKLWKHLGAFPKALKSISLETFLLRQRAGCEWVLGWVSGLPLFRSVYLTQISIETRLVSEVTWGLPRRNKQKDRELKFSYNPKKATYGKKSWVLLCLSLRHNPQN